MLKFHGLALVVAILFSISGCADPLADAPGQPDAPNFASDWTGDVVGQRGAAGGNFSPALDAPPHEDVVAEVSDEAGAKKSVVQSLLRAVTRGAAEALDEKADDSGQR